MSQRLKSAPEQEKQVAPETGVPEVVEQTQELAETTHEVRGTVTKSLMPTPDQEAKGHFPARMAKNHSESGKFPRIDLPSRYERANRKDSWIDL